MAASKQVSRGNPFAAATLVISDKEWHRVRILEESLTPWLPDALMRIASAYVRVDDDDAQPWTSVFAETAASTCPCVWVVGRRATGKSVLLEAIKSWTDEQSHDCRIVSVSSFLSRGVGNDHCCTFVQDVEALLKAPTTSKAFFFDTADDIVLHSPAFRELWANGMRRGATNMVCVATPDFASLPPDARAHADYIVVPSRPCDVREMRRLWDESNCGFAFIEFRAAINAFFDTADYTRDVLIISRCEVGARTRCYRLSGECILSAYKERQEMYESPGYTEAVFASLFQILRITGLASLVCEYDLVCHRRNITRCCREFVKRA